MLKWFDVEDIGGDTDDSSIGGKSIIKDRCVSFDNVRDEFLFDIGVDTLGTSGEDKLRYGHDSTEIARHHNFLVTIAGLFVQNAGNISVAEQSVLFVSKMLRLAYSYANRTGLFGEGVYAHFDGLITVPWSRYMLPTAPTQKNHVISATASYYKARWITSVRSELRNNLHPAYDSLIKEHGGVLPSGDSIKDFEYKLIKKIWMCTFKKGKEYHERVEKAEANEEAPPASPALEEMQLSIAWLAWYRLGPLGDDEQQLVKLCGAGDTADGTSLAMQANQKGTESGQSKGKGKGKTKKTVSADAVNSQNTSTGGLLNDNQDNPPPTPMEKMSTAITLLSSAFATKTTDEARNERKRELKDLIQMAKEMGGKAAMQDAWAEFKALTMPTTIPSSSNQKPEVITINNEVNAASGQSAGDDEDDDSSDQSASDNNNDNDHDGVQSAGDDDDDKDDDDDDDDDDVVIATTGDDDNDEEMQPSNEQEEEQPQRGEWHPIRQKYVPIKVCSNVSPAHAAPTSPSPSTSLITRTTPEESLSRSPNPAPPPTPSRSPSPKATKCKSRTATTTLRGASKRKAANLGVKAKKKVNATRTVRKLPVRHAGVPLKFQKH